MSWLAKVQNAPPPKPPRIVLFSAEGVGKTTFAASAPSPIFIGSEDGYGNLDVARFPSPATLRDVGSQLAELATEKHAFQTAVVDTLDWLEPLVWADVCRRAKAASIEDVGGGFGKGYTEALEVWSLVMADLDKLRDKGMTVLVLAHSQTRTTKNPDGPDYDRFTLKINDKAAARWKEWADMVLFARFDDRVTTTTKAGTEDKRLNSKGKGIAGGRKLYTTRTPAYDAKNRCSLPFCLPLSWPDLMAAMPRDAQAEVAGLRVRAEALLAEVDLEPEKAEKTRALIAERAADLQFMRTLIGKLEALPLKEEG